MMAQLMQQMMVRDVLFLWLQCLTLFFSEIIQANNAGGCSLPTPIHDHFEVPVALSPLDLVAEMASPEAEPPPIIPLPAEPPLPEAGEYVLIVHHPASQSHQLEEQLSLDNYIASTTTLVKHASNSISWWYPFESKADFIFAEWVTKKNHSANDIKDLLYNIENEWASGGTKLTFHNSQNIDKILERAKMMTTQVSNFFICRANIYLHII
jgi:hypothetical protein